MPIQPSDLIAVASALALATGEPSDRSAISRAYYAAFHCARAWHDGLVAPGNNAGPGGGEHQVLINRLRNPDSNAVGAVTARYSRILATKLEVLRNRRVTADYDLHRAVIRPECDQQLSQATEVLRAY